MLVSNSLVTVLVEVTQLVVVVQAAKGVVRFLFTLVEHSVTFVLAHQVLLLQHVGVVDSEVHVFKATGTEAFHDSFVGTCNQGVAVQDGRIANIVVRSSLFRPEILIVHHEGSLKVELDASDITVHVRRNVECRSLAFIDFVPVPVVFGRFRLNHIEHGIVSDSARIVTDIAVFVESFVAHAVHAKSFDSILNVSVFGVGPLGTSKFRLQARMNGALHNHILRIKVQDSRIDHVVFVIHCRNMGVIARTRALFAVKGINVVSAQGEAEGFDTGIRTEHVAVAPVKVKENFVVFLCNVTDTGASHLGVNVRKRTNFKAVVLEVQTLQQAVRRRIQGTQGESFATLRSEDFGLLENFGLGNINRKRGT